MREKDLIGKRIRLKGEHEWAGAKGEIVRLDETSTGMRPVVRLDPSDDVPEGTETLVPSPDQMTFIQN